MIQFGAVTEEFVIAEDSTLVFDLCRDPEYPFEDGAYRVPSGPGLGLEVDQDLYERRRRSMEALLQG